VSDGGDINEAVIASELVYKKAKSILG